MDEQQESQPKEPVEDLIPKTEEEASAPENAETAASSEEQATETATIDPMRVKLKAYDGPLDLLLDLIKKNEMDIYDIPIAEITKQYLAYLAEMKKFDLEIAGEFLVIAATLIYIKSKMILPQETDEDEDLEGDDPRTELVQKLLEYQAFKHAAKELGLLEGERRQTFTRKIADYYLADLDPEDTEIDSFSANLFDLLTAFQTVMTRAGRDELHEVFEEVISIEERTEQIRVILTQRGRMLFVDLFNEKWSRNHLIVTFLAVLEIVRSRFAFVEQEKQFGEIVIQKK